MKIEFKFLPTLVTSYPSLSSVPVTKGSVVFKCFRCKNYIRDKFITEDVYIVDIDYMPIGLKLNDGCTVDPGFTKLEYDDKGFSQCSKFKKDYSIGRKL